MSSKKRESFQLKLTPRQQEEIRMATGKDAEALELTVEELEERIAPSYVSVEGSGPRTGEYEEDN